MYVTNNSCSNAFGHLTKPFLIINKTYSHSLLPLSIYIHVIMRNTIYNSYHKARKINKPSNIKAIITIVRQYISIKYI